MIENMVLYDREGLYDRETLYDRGSMVEMLQLGIYDVVEESVMESGVFYDREGIYNRGSMMEKCSMIERFNDIAGGSMTESPRGAL